MISGANLTKDTPLFGAAAGQEFGGAVNLKLEAGTLTNLAAGAGDGGTVADVNLTFGEDAAVTGITFAGGQGNVTGAVKTLVDGGTFGGVFVAGTFSNRINTAVGSVNLTVNGGNFEGNAYGGSQVRYVSGKTNTVGSITANLNYVDSVKDAFCFYAGGMAAGADSAKTANAYEVTGDINVSVTGGNWCNDVAHGGRGLFGGIFAGDSGSTKTGVRAEVKGSVNIDIDGGTLGNVYGGGWAQKGGVSVVDSVNITVTGGEIVNVIGGGSHSATSGGTTLVENGVNITVSGGDIVGNIYARGHLTGDTVNGDAVVTFTATENTEYNCSVYGYGVEAQAHTGYSYLVFEDYAGSLTASIGGFDTISFTGDAQVTFTEGIKTTDPLHPTYGPIDPAAVATVENGVWDFDLTERGAAHASDAMLTWSGDMSADSVTLRFGADAAVSNSWTIATGLSGVAEAYDLWIVGVTGSITAELGVAIDGTGTAYDKEWAVVFENDTLKFAKVTA